MIERIITADESGSRLDRIIHKNYKYLTQAKIEIAIRKKLITLNDKKASSNLRVNENDILKISSKLIEDSPATSKKVITGKELHLIKDNIIFQNEYFIVLNKPSGLAVQGGSKIKISIDDIMPEYIKTIETWSEEKAVHKLVHRLDKETSGILIIALNNKSAQQLAQNFKQKTCKKTYYAILTGEVKKDRGTISTIIDKENKGISKENAQTKFRVIKKNKLASFIEFQPITGKTHQLRLHSLELGFPIFGDDKYDINCPENAKLHLHAGEIEFPFNQKIESFSAKIPEYCINSLKKFKLN